MREILESVESWRRDGHGVALATVVQVWGSAPRPPGSKMAISSHGAMAGSVSGGCVEGAVFEEAQEVIRSGRPKLLTFGVSDEEAWTVGLSCGGEIQVFVESLGGERETATGAAEIYRAIREGLEAEEFLAQATVVAGPGLGKSLLFRRGRESLGSLGAEGLDDALRDRIPERFEREGARRIPVEGKQGASEVFLEFHGPRPKLVLVGAVHVAIPLIHLAKAVGFRTLVIDPRGAFATAERFAHADELIREWPQEALGEMPLNEATYIATLSHDPKIDLPAVAAVLRQPVRYIGALGSKKTHAKRVAALEEQGFSDEEIDRIHAPIGLDLGGRKPEEIAVAILAQVVAAANGKDTRARG